LAASAVQAVLVEAIPAERTRTAAGLCRDSNINSKNGGCPSPKLTMPKNQWFREGEMLPFEMVGGGTDTS